MRKSAKEGKRLILPDLADLIDSLTIYQIKEAKLTGNRRHYLGHLQKLSHDIDLVFQKSRTKKISKLIRQAVVLAQVNLSIWELKDRMQKEPENYVEFLKRAHQLNGVRNRIKNELANFNRLKKIGEKHTNLEVDNLDEWKIGS